MQLIRRPTALGARRLLATAAPAARPALIEKTLSSDGVLTVRFDNEKKARARACRVFLAPPLSPLSLSLLSPL